MELQRRRAYNNPTVWSSKEEKKLLLYLKTELFDIKKVKELFPNRTLPSIKSKVRKLRIKHDLFGSCYRDDKQSFTSKIAAKVKPKVVFDAYAGSGHQTFKWIEAADKVFASEIINSKINQFEKLARMNGFIKQKASGDFWQLFVKNEKKIYFFSGDAIDAAAILKVRRENVDLIDLDTCGSTLPLLSTFLVLLKPKHLVITHGEFHSMRFKREDVLRRLFLHRDIGSNPLPLDSNSMSNELDKAVKVAALRAHNETEDSFWLNLEDEIWLGSKTQGMLRRHYTVIKPTATADCINMISNLK